MKMSICAKKGKRAEHVFISIPEIPEMEASFGSISGYGLCQVGPGPPIMGSRLRSR